MLFFPRRIGTLPDRGGWGTLDQVNARDDVPPLVGAAYLDPTVVPLVEVTEIECLKELVAEFCKRDTLLRG